MADKKDEEKKQVKFQTIGSQEDASVCGPEGCNLAAHFAWAKEKQDKQKNNKEQK